MSPYVHARKVKRMNEAEMKKLIEALDAINGYDSEMAHDEADKILQEAVPAEVREAYRRVEARSGGFW